MFEKKRKPFGDDKIRQKHEILLARNKYLIRQKNLLKNFYGKIDWKVGAEKNEKHQSIYWNTNRNFSFF